MWHTLLHESGRGVFMHASQHATWRAAPGRQTSSAHWSLGVRLTCYGSSSLQAEALAHELQEERNRHLDAVDEVGPPRRPSLHSSRPIGLQAPPRAGCQCQRQFQECSPPRSRACLHAGSHGL